MKKEDEKTEGEVLENVHTVTAQNTVSASNNVNASLYDSVQNDSNVHNDYVKLYEQCN